ncbi:MAG: hypothetical protein GVY29_03075 [Spirochaetes bacterium]|nr:hypothetical protein [Spirochaetota bacterium]
MLGVSATQITAAQSEAELIDEIRSAEAVTYRQAGLAALAAAGEVDLRAMRSTIDGTADRLLENELPLSGVVPQDAVTTSQFAYIIAEAFPIPGGVMYRAFPSPRYALRDLRFYDILPQELEARERIDGRTALGVISRARAWVQERGL